jgi:outer membrane protein OmpA-like peptidoglycan-associated protein
MQNMLKKRMVVLVLSFIILLGIGQPAFGSWSSPENNTLSQDSGMNNRVVTITITGRKLNKTMTVKLTKTGEQDIMADNLNITSETQISCSLDLRNKPIGAWDVVIITQRKFLFMKSEKTTVLREGFSITAPPLPVLHHITPSQGLNNGPVSVTIDGSNFDKAITVKLIRSDQTLIPGKNVNVESDSAITCVLDLSQKPVGTYQLEVTDANGRSVVLPDAFGVEAPLIVSDLNRDLKPLFFEFNKSAIPNSQLSRLQYDWSILNSNPKLYILLGGHSDQWGSRNYNLKLSAKRAETVKKYLVQQGIDPERITVYAYGEDFPVKKDCLESNWQADRRVDISVWETPPTREQGIGDGMDETFIPGGSISPICELSNSGS